MSAEEEEQAQEATESPKPKKKIIDYLPWWENTPDRFSFFLVIATFFLAFVTGGLWWATRDLVIDARDSGEKQLRVLHDQLNEMKSSGEDTKKLIAAAQASAKAAQDAIKLAEETTKSQLRAYVYLDTCRIGYFNNNALVSCDFKNTGQTPAQKLATDASIFVMLDGVLIREKALPSKGFYGSVGRDGIYTFQVQFDAEDKFFEFFKAGRIKIRFKGQISFIDIFDENRTIPFELTTSSFVGPNALFVQTEENKQKEEKVPETAH
jgi:hypothetical protein